MREALRAIVAVSLVVGALSVASVFKSSDPEPSANQAISEAPKRKAKAPKLDATEVAEANRCPDMTNPGGLDWRPSKNPGPLPTNGTIAIPAMSVRAPIVQVGVGKDKRMVIPRNPHEVAWLHQGTFPGDTQNAVLAGHVNYSGAAGVFSKLQSLKPGENVSVKMDGKRWDYTVRWNCLFDRDTDLASKIMGRTDVQSVTLISCGGVFDRAAGTHTKRIAVRAELVGLIG